MTALDHLQQMLPYLFRDDSLLDTALTHRSYVNENPSELRRDNERLEFLGDAVLELCISDLLMKNFPDYQEGPLSQLRAAIVNEQPLAEMAKSFRLGDYLLLGKGEEASGGRCKPSLLANTFEALIAAIYLDGGFEEAAALIRRLFTPLIEEGYRTYRDYKTTVQQISQHAFKETPRYTLIQEYGPDHSKTFEIQLSISDRIQTTGTGKNKKEAEQRAAEQAIRILETLLPPGRE
ncbi:MAG: ribonuclease III [Deltaproteobacteria bacterium HGW-Deltaproteobacteria-9]|nr:MAG: ribonuclease III [Deltaproteobacteria bacterium HGW-Deltaproteobacteria-9]